MNFSMIDNVQMRDKIFPALAKGNVLKMHELGLDTIGYMQRNFQLFKNKNLSEDYELIFKHIKGYSYRVFIGKKDASITYIKTLAGKTETITTKY